MIGKTVTPCKKSRLENDLNDVTARFMTLHTYRRFNETKKMFQANS